MFVAELIFLLILAGVFLYFIRGNISKSAEIHNSESIQINANLNKETHSNSNQKRTFKVFVDDHFHYMKEAERYLEGEYSSVDEALNVCKEIVDQFLKNHVKKNTTPDGLFDHYMSFGEDPFIEGNDFSAANYAKQRSKEIIAELADKTEVMPVGAIDMGWSMWAREITFKYSSLSDCRKFYENDQFIYYVQKDSKGSVKDLIAGWNKQTQKWVVNVDYKQLENCSQVTEEVLEMALLSTSDENLVFYRKQYLMEYLMLGLGRGEVKSVRIAVNNRGMIEISILADTWNDMVIGNQVGIDGFAEFTMSNCEDPTVVRFALLCDAWRVNIEVVFDEYEDYELYEFGLKEFHGYYQLGNSLEFR